MDHTSKEDIASRMNSRFYSNVQNSNYQPRISSTDDLSQHTQKKREQENNYFNGPIGNYPIRTTGQFKSSTINEYEKEFNNIPDTNLWKAKQKQTTFRDKDLNDRLTQFEPTSQVRSHPINYDISNVEMKPIDTRQSYYKENT